MKPTWEGEAYVDSVGRVRFLDPTTGELPSRPDGEQLRGEMFNPSLVAGKGSLYGLQGRRVRVMISALEAKDVEVEND
jgi:hypothetical protein